MVDASVKSEQYFHNNNTDFVIQAIPLFPRMLAGYLYPIIKNTNNLAQPV